ncbi:hypothetical protein BDW59DRAFT_153547 [Aspergillus cavernicola]|uniref:Uncharacterized protein n=1 Tax=Aspergillus cavernicola TaxID=176166 RepID=A0ABR4HK36_9EURO
MLGYFLEKILSRAWLPLPTIPSLLLHLQISRLALSALQIRISIPSPQNCPRTLQVIAASAYAYSSSIKLLGIGSHRLLLFLPSPEPCSYW